MDGSSIATRGPDSMSCTPGCCAGLYDQGRALFEEALNLSDLTEGRQLEADEEYRICARRGSNEEAKPTRRKQRKIKDVDVDE